MRRQWSQALARGVDRLLSGNAEGRWTSFPTRAGASDVWVTAFVVAHLKDLKVRTPVVSRARAFLANARHPGGGWSYGGMVPPDADSTAWCLLALQGTRHLSAASAREARAFLASHATADGIATYREDGGIRRYIEVPPSISIAGWTSPHDDVTAAALLAGVPSLASDDGLRALGRLVSRQSGAGFWDAYWWRGPLYTTTLILWATAAAGYRLPDAAAGRLFRALQREQLADGGFALGASVEADPFTTALALECFCRLAYLGGDEHRQAAAQCLVNLQQPDGGWTGDYVLRIPAPNVADPRHVSGWSRGTGGGNSYVLDERGTYATALACHALAMTRRLHSPQRRHAEIVIIPEPAGEEALVTADG